MGRMKRQTASKKSHLTISEKLDAGPNFIYPDSFKE